MSGHLAKPWHVAHVIGTLGVGGAERQLVNYLLVADRDRFRHTAVCLSKARELADELKDSAVEVVELEVRTRSLAPSLGRFVRWLRGQNVSVVHTHMFYAALWGRVAGILAGVPVLVTTEHGKELWKRSWQIHADRLLSRRTCRHIAVSRDGMRIRMQREHVPAPRIVHIPNGVQVHSQPSDESARGRIRREFGLRPDQPVIGTVGRAVEAKGYPYLLQAVVLLKQRYPDLHWLQIGEGDRLEGLREQALRAGVADSITFAGTRSDIPAHLAAIDIFVMSSIREGLPLALLEGMAARKAIVVTSVGGMAEVVEDDVTGLMVQPADPQALADAVGSLIDDPGRAERLAAAAFSKASEKYSITATARRIEAVYLDCLAAKGAAVGG